MVDAIGTARLRLDRVRSHMDEFVQVSKDFINNGEHYVVAENEHDTQEFFYRLEMQEEFPTTLGLVVGDALHQLRATLDGLYKALALQHRWEKDATFPIRKSIKGFREQARQAPLCRFPKTVIDALEEVQPDNRRQILRLLHDLNIVDKHRALLVTGSTAKEITFTFEGGILHTMACIGPIENHGAVARVYIVEPPPEGDLEAYLRLDVAFNEIGESYGRLAWQVVMEAHNFIRDEVIPIFEAALSHG